MNSPIDVFIVYGNCILPFEIQSKCRLGRMIQVINEGLGIEIDIAIHYQNEDLTKSQILSDPDKYLMEDYGILAGQRIVVIGKKKCEGIFPASIDIRLMYEEKIITDSCQIFAHTTVKHMIDLIQQNTNLAPGSVRITYKGVNLNNPSKKLIADLHVSDGDIMVIHGSGFRLPILGPGFHFAKDQ